MIAVLTIIAYILGSALAVALCWAVLLWAVMRYAGRKIDVDRDEDCSEADARVQQIVDSMRGTL